MSQDDTLIGCPLLGGQHSKYSTIYICSSCHHRGYGVAEGWDKGRWDGCGPDVCGVDCARWRAIPAGVVCRQGPCVGASDGRCATVVVGPTSDCGERWVAPTDQGSCGEGSPVWGPGAWQWMLCALVTLWTLLLGRGCPTEEVAGGGKVQGYPGRLCSCCRVAAWAPEAGAPAGDEGLGALGPGGGRPALGVVKDRPPQGGGIRYVLP